MNLPTVVINGRALSDIFFNFDHTMLRNACNAAEEGLTDEEYRAALAIDAKDFCQMIGAGQVDPQELIEDFMARR